MILPPVAAYRDRVTNRAKLVCSNVGVDKDPQIIPYRKVKGAIGGECFENVRSHIKKFGGEVVDGWAVWEFPPLEVQAEFHSVWETPEGDLVDITPPLHGGQKTTFLRGAPDEVYEGRNRSAVYLPYDETEIAKRYVELSRRWQELVFPEGDLQEPTFKMTPEIMQVTMEKAETELRRS